MSTRPKSKLSLAPLSLMGSSDSESESAARALAPSAASAFRFRFSAFFSALVFFFFSRHSLAFAAFSAVSSAFLATRDASILAFRRSRSSSSRSPPPPSPRDQPAAVGGAPAAGAASFAPFVLAADASPADGSSLARALSPLGVLTAVFFGGVSESSSRPSSPSSPSSSSSSEEEEEEETSSSKSDSFSDSGSSESSSASAPGPAAPSAPSLSLIFSSEVIAFPGWSLARSAFLEFSFAACLAAALALLVFWNLDHSGFASSGT
mmetsp:Transcript_7162/g.28179  ORF Transcript_7162/g.28179 Transcript_7162/m.28179 type:complete len:264 (+) Transcript_7162:1686-2477(+)